MSPKDSINNYSVFSCFFVALTATLGSLFFSEVMDFPPCIFCWYQRIAMYPLVILFLVGLFQPVRATINFTLPITLIGWGIALYHNLLHFGIVPESATPCREGLSCSTIFINWLGFITIPLLSFMAFSMILIISIFLLRRSNNE